ncbi:sel1 repeat family protein (plasmid) [Phyllobacterium sp. A18/5-2]|uniref:tetratricopeptide repeat protein n=1 Tax=Phyllobacterium sp. A18/5-2 TaxID=2978392 RepID=UPI0021C6B5B7|nr:tetratricopeptide repeat protein [Phyllobacterium sp. A18/5-2]UXN67440.1 sel1 repeat family protein [Phyllobacterium sp. A18/5-2]
MPKLKTVVSRSLGANALRRFSAVATLLLAFAQSATSAGAEDSSALFREALRQDLKGGPADARLAFDMYRRAAEAGLPEAQFNVAIMLDSGRGVSPDVAQAATWYARAASHGIRRAAYNLGQLYEAGQGVPQNVDLARAWFKASDLPAARARLTAIRSGGAKAATLSAPVLVAPADGELIGSGANNVELVWTARQGPEGVRFFVELRALVPSGSREIYSGFVDVSSLNVALSSSFKGAFAWRVFAVAQGSGRYAASNWSYLSTSAN